jgi:putative nucleotidyltransferase with HDIG domain
LNREEAWNLLCEWTESDSLRKHMLAVEAAMRTYARKFGEDEERWGITGLLHDMDYEKHPTPADHPMVGVRELERRGYPEDVLHMRPDGLEGLKAKSVRKKMKQKSFAAAVNREDIVRGAEELGVDLDEHVEFVAGALRERSDALGLAPKGA